MAATTATGAAALLPWTRILERSASAQQAVLRRDSQGILELADGFTYEILERAGDEMDDGYLVPGRPDGMACFTAADGSYVLMRNHENGIGAPGGAYPPGVEPPPEAYNPEATGGVTRLVLDPVTLERRSSNLVLTGTVRNCAGGPSPWGWLSCEESVEPSHGYVFLCPDDATGVQEPQRIVGYGRFNHEAAAIDPSTNVCYLTEDRGDSCLYRFVPGDPDTPFEGRLEALRVVGSDRYPTTGLREGQILNVEWVPIDEPDPEEDTVRVEAQSKGAAIFVRGEGIWFHEGAVYICCTAGGPINAGQIFRLIDGDEQGMLELVATTDDASVLQMPDNITLAPWGDIYVAEDGGPTNHIRMIDRDGQVATLARNVGSGSEFAGVCFSPKGDALFVNIQADGLTLVIRGPFVPDGDTGGTSGGDDTGDTSGGSSGPDSDGTGAETGGAMGTGTSGSGSGSSAGDSESGTDGTGAGTAGQDDGGDDGCSCSTGDNPPGVAAAIAGITLALARSRSDPKGTDDGVT